MLIKILAYLIIGLYTLSLTYILMYCLIQFHLLIKYRQSQKRHLHNNANPLPSNYKWPAVTIQLPVYNEAAVIERLIDNIVLLKYPGELLQIQVLDDSTDRTQALALAKVNEYKANGIHIEYNHRQNRSGFKAGALRDGLTSATGEFIAIFDADFLPQADFLLKTIPYFDDERIGVVQTRWEHINGNYSLLTRLQAFQLNVHFTIEQSGRAAGGFPLQFNGTAGVWRAKTIEDAGGWEADTLTEDLDLSYRAQLKGWKIKYLQDIGTPAELPIEINGLKSQQYRWMKGGAENARKLIPAIWKSDLSFLQKVHSTGHLLSSSIFLVVFLMAILSVPTLFLFPYTTINLRLYSIFMLGLLTLSIVYYSGNSDTTWKKENTFQRIASFVLMFPIFLSLSMGLSWHTSSAVLAGWRGRKSEFVRTPKYNIGNALPTSTPTPGKTSSLSIATITEGLIALYFLVAIVLGLLSDQTIFIVYHLMLMIGFGSLSLYGILHNAFKSE